MCAPEIMAPENTPDVFSHDNTDNTLQPEAGGTGSSHLPRGLPLHGRGPRRRLHLSVRWVEELLERRSLLKVLWKFFNTQYVNWLTFNAGSKQSIIRLQ